MRFLAVIFCLIPFAAFAQDAPSTRVVGCVMAGTGVNITSVAPSNGCNGTLTVNSSAETTVTLNSGLLTSASSTPFGFAQVLPASTVDSFVGSATSFTCSVNPVITLENCASNDLTCGTPTAVGTVTLTAAGAAVIGTVSAGSITAAHLLTGKITAGTCTALQVNLQANYHAN